MKIARFSFHGRPVVAVDAGRGFIDYGAILEARGYRSEIAGSNPEHRLIRLAQRGLLAESFIAEQLTWAREGGRNFTIETGDSKPLLPLKPGKIVCVARNWEDHAREGGHDLPPHPVYFAKTPNCAVGPHDGIPVPEDAGQVDHEGELGVVVGRTVKRAKAVDCDELVLGYTCINDVTARAFQRELASNRWPWYAAKSMDGFAPIGPWLITRGEAEPLEGRRIKVTVNGEVRQDGTIDDMHWKVPELIEAISRNITLEVGDIIATGTPFGVGPIQPGDEVAVEIDGIGRLVNPVVKVPDN